MPLLLLIGGLLIFNSCVRHHSPYLGIQPNGTRVPGEIKEIPEDALRAEMAKDWTRAISIYKEKLAGEPNRSDLWVRVAQNEARLNHLDHAVLSLKKAAELAPREATIYFELSRAYAMSDNPKQGLEAIEKAVKLEPENKTYLEARAKLANWVGKPKTAGDSYRRLAKLSGDNPENELLLAQADTWSGYLDKAAKTYKGYIKKNPQRKDAILEYVQVETWRGNFKHALALLKLYFERFGEDLEYRKAHADVLARSGLTKKAIIELDKLLLENPGNYELQFSRAIALHYGKKIHQAQQVLDALNMLRPDSRETLEINRFINMPLRSFARFYGGYYWDSDNISILSGQFDASLALSKVTRLNAAGGVDYLRAQRTPFRNIDGSEDALHTFARLGGQHRFSPTVALEGYMGSAKVEDLDAVFVYDLTLDLRPNDHLTLHINRDHGYFIISPRTVSLGVERTRNRFVLNWRPDLANTLALQGSYETFSDENKRWEVIFFPRTLTVRSEGLNLDLGFRGWWFGYDYDPGNGYWAPDFFQSYMGAALGYWKISENDGLSFQAAAGWLKDNTMDHFEFGYSFDLEAVFGIYKNMMLKLRGSYLHNLRQGTGAFDAYLFSLSLTMRL